MKVVVISDIHSNFVALEAVMVDIDEKFEEIDFYLNVGDIIGYGPYPNEVCDLLKGLNNLISVKGNHEEALITGDTSGLISVASEAIEWTNKNISNKNLSFLKKMNEYEALKLNGFKVFLVHGSPRDYLHEYLRPDFSDELYKWFLKDTDADLIVTGHTHVSFVKEFGRKLVMNAGSVGQPRDGNPASCYAVLDTEKPEIKFHRVNYNVDKVMEKVNEVGLPETFGNRLYYGV